LIGDLRQHVSIELMAALEISRILQVCALECGRRADVAEHRHQVEIGECYFHQFANAPANDFSNAKIELFESQPQPNLKPVNHEIVTYQRAIFLYLISAPGHLSTGRGSECGRQRSRPHKCFSYGQSPAAPVA